MCTVPLKTLTVCSLFNFNVKIFLLVLLHVPINTCILEYLSIHVFIIQYMLKLLLLFMVFMFELLYTLITCTCS